MMNIKSIAAALAAIALLAAAGCKKDDDGGSGGKHDGNPPKLFINGEDIWEDTLKFTLNPELLLSFEVDDDRDKRILSMSRLDGGLVYYDGKLLNNAAASIDGIRQGQLRFRALEAGAMSFFLSVEDEDGKAGTALVKIISLANLKPQAALGVQQTDANAPYEVRISADGSKDADEAWGGAVSKYEYTLEGFYTTVTTLKQINYIYPAPGRYRITLRVQDNEGAWSDPVSREVVVE
jgi:hypothetical protein